MIALHKCLTGNQFKDKVLCVPMQMQNMEILPTKLKERREGRGGRRDERVRKGGRQKEGREEGP